MDWGHAAAAALAPFVVKLIDAWDKNDRKKRGDKPSLLTVLAFRCGRLARKIRGQCRGDGLYIGRDKLP